MVRAANKAPPCKVRGVGAFPALEDISGEEAILLLYRFMPGKVVLFLEFLGN